MKSGIHRLSQYLDLYSMPIAIANEHQMLFLNKSFRATFSNLASEVDLESLLNLDTSHFSELSLSKHSFNYQNESYSIYVDSSQYEDNLTSDRFVMYKYMMDHHKRLFKGCALKPQIIRNEKKPPVFFLNHSDHSHTSCMIKICPSENVNAITLIILDFLIKSIEQNEASNCLELISNEIDKWADENGVRLEMMLVNIDFEGNWFHIHKNNGHVYLIKKSGELIQIDGNKPLSFRLDDLDFGLLSTEALPVSLFKSYDGINPIHVLNKSYKHFETNKSDHLTEVGNLLIKPNLGEQLYTYSISSLSEMQNIIDQILIETGVNASEDFAIRLILSELVTNAFKHTSHEREAPFVNVLIHLTPNSISIEVYNIDHSKNQEVLEKASLPEDLLSEGGRGLFLVKEFASALYETNDSVIALVKRGKKHEEKLEI